MAEGLALADRIRAEKLKEQIRMLEKEQAEIAARLQATTPALKQNAVRPIWRLPTIAR
jgi:hypothetical protein